jgi:hypothetical protein
MRCSLYCLSVHPLSGSLPLQHEPDTRAVMKLTYWILIAAAIDSLTLLLLTCLQWIAS